jgi:outer membrane protein assembly factor BamB
MKNSFSVTLPWSASNNHGDQGTYSTTVHADSEGQAVLFVAEEMADSLPNDFKTPEDRQKYIDNMINVNGDVYSSVDQLRQSIDEVFADELFPDGCHKTINLDVLGKILAANREFLLKPDWPNSLGKG